MSRVTAVLLSFHRPAAITEVLEHLRALPVDEVVVYDNGDDDLAAAAVRAFTAGGAVTLLTGEGNIGIAGRNRAAEAASGDYLLMLDDDSYPLPGAIETLVDLLDRNPHVAAVGGLVRDVDDAKQVVLETGPGTFDWWLRNGHDGPVPADGVPAFFFPEGASLVRRSAFLDVGGFYEPFFFTSEGVELATRLIGAGWDVRYQPAAVFDHMKAPAGRASTADSLRLRIRNNLWYLWLRFPPLVAVTRIPAYALFDLVNAVYRKAPRSWLGGVADAWRLRDTVAADRKPIPADRVDLAEGTRLRLHARLLAARIARLRRR